ncbi:MAG: signal recognition particle-docking protein FtsY [Planctomycetota bacterium]|jgi:fused signal recognition particle receptor
MLNLIKRGLKKTAKILTTDIRDLLKLRRTIDRDFLDDLEEILVTADLGPRFATRVVEDLQLDFKDRRIEDPDLLIEHLKGKLKTNLKAVENAVLFAPAPPTVIMVGGVNGVGKTTSIGKLAYYFREEGKKVLLAACDTFRAAAVEQLDLWAHRVGADIVKGKQGSDAAAVAFDAVDAALARKVDILLVDTAGRLHTRENLMKELSKIKRVITRKLPEAPHEVLLVLDATTGQNAINQAKRFKEVIDVTGLFLAKLDGTAKGGVVLAIVDQIETPVKFIGVGEKQEDVLAFNADEFIEGLFQ